MNTYDALHRRIAKQILQNLPMAGWTCLKTITFTYDGWNVIEKKELDGSAGTPARHHRYTWGADLSGTLQGAGGVGGLLMAEELPVSGNASPTAHYYWYDGNGNVAGLMSDTGLVEATHRYTSFGGDLETYLANPGTYASRNPWRFSNKYLDREVETSEGLYYYGYRHYLTALGRWMTRDPIGERGGVNLYGMVLNCSISTVDFLGFQSVASPAGAAALAGLEVAFGGSAAAETVVVTQTPGIGAAITTFFASLWHKFLDEDYEPQPDRLWDRDKRRRDKNKLDDNIDDCVGKDPDLQKKYKDFLHQKKQKEGKGGQDNFTWEELKDACDEFKQQNNL